MRRRTDTLQAEALQSSLISQEEDLSMKINSDLSRKIEGPPACRVKD